MTDYVVGIDRGSGHNDSKILGDIVSAVKKCSGGSVTSLGVGPSVVQNYGLTSGAKGKVGIYITNGVGIATPNDLAQSYYHYDHVIFAWPQYIDNQWMSDENIKNHVIKGEWDWNRASSWNVGGQTAAQWFSANSKVDLVAGTSAEDIAQRICSGTYVTAEGNPGSATAGGGATGNGTGGQSNTSPLLSGDMTFEELVGEICKGIDVQFLCKRSTVVVSDFSTIFAEAMYLRDKYNSSVSDEDIKLWQLEEDSYELNVAHHAFYNTVKVVYKNGTVKESFSDLVRIYGEVAITYKEKTLDKTTAQMKAKAYLAAHLRDFELSVQATILSEPNIDIGDIVTLDNPLSMQNATKTAEGGLPEYLFVKGVRTEWEGDSPITTDLELQFAPTSPERREVPTAGLASNNQSGTGETTGGTSGFGTDGVSQDGSKIMAIGRPSSTAESKYGYKFYKSVFERKCPFCKGTELYWGIFWAGNETSNYGTFPKTGRPEGGSAEGHIFCKSCDADFSCIIGADHQSPPRAYLTRVSGPTECTKQDAYNLKNGTSGNTNNTNNNSNNTTNVNKTNNKKKKNNSG